MRPTLLVLLLCGLLAAPLFAQNATEKSAASQADPAQAGAGDKKDENKGDKKDENKGDKKDENKGDKKDDKKTDEPKTGGKELKIIAQGPWMVPPTVTSVKPEDISKGDLKKDTTLVVRSIQDLTKIPPLSSFPGGAPQEFVDKFFSELSKTAFKGEKVNFEKQMVVIVSSGQGTMPGYAAKITKAEVKDGKLNIHWNVSAITVEPGTPMMLMAATAALIEKFDGKIEFIKPVTKSSDGPKPPIGPDGKPLVLPVGPDGKPLPFPKFEVGPDGKIIPPLGPDGKPLLPTIKPPVGPDGKPLPAPVGPDGKPLPAPVGPDGKPLLLPPSIQPPGLNPPGLQPPAGGTQLPGLPGLKLPVPTPGSGEQKSPAPKSPNPPGQ